jgi:hypothetical protein
MYIVLVITKTLVIITEKHYDLDFAMHCCITHRIMNVQVMQVVIHISVFEVDKITENISDKYDLRFSMR